MTRQETSDVLIVGGGLFGCFTGLFLARRGLRVTLLERGIIGAQASATNFGNLRLHGRSEKQYPLSIRAQELWESYESLTGENCEICQTGHLYFATTDEGETSLRANAETAESFGVVSQVVEGNDLRRRFPFLAPEVRIAAFSPRSAVANPRLSTPPVARMLQTLGGRVIENCEVLAAHCVGSDFEVHTSDRRRFVASRLVNAAGAWSGHLAEQFGERVPMFSAGPPQFVTEPLPHKLHPVAHMVEGDVIVRQIKRGNVIFAGYPRTHSLPNGEFTHVPPAKTMKGMKALGVAIPMLRRAEVIRVWSGVEGYLPDMQPILGPSSTTAGLFHAFGGSGGGFQIAPAVGEGIAALVAGDPTPRYLDGYGIERFSTRYAVSERVNQEFDVLDQTVNRLAILTP